jgi:hypothetical protein
MTSGVWTAEQLPPETVDAVRAAVGTLVSAIADAVRTENPVYADVLVSPEGVGIRLGIEQAIRSFLDAIERGERPAKDTGEMWRRLGEAEFQAGRSLEGLRAAFRTGVRAAWRAAADQAAAAGVPAPAVIKLAEAIFIYADELTNDVIEGYLRIQSDEAGERERRRRRLASLLLDPAGHDREAIERAAELARWPLPRTVAVLVLDADTPGPVTRRLDSDALAGADAAGAWLLLPDPERPRHRASLERALGGAPSALGPAVPLRDAHRSLRWARAALELVKRGALAPQSPTRVSDHLSSLLLLHDDELAAALVAERLAPLERLPAAERDRLLETIEAWLAHQRHTPAIAQALHVHPQTVRYRIAKARELLGDALTSPDGRFELELALRVRRARGGG